MFWVLQATLFVCLYVCQPVRPVLLPLAGAMAFALFVCIHLWVWTGAASGVPHAALAISRPWHAFSFILADIMGCHTFKET